MDNQATEPSGALNVDGAAQAFGALLDPPPIEEKSAQELENEVLDDLNKPKQEAEANENTQEEAAEDDEGVTIEVDGKQVKLSKAELADAYKNGLRQSDYTKKTMEVAEQRKQAQAEFQKAVEERNNYAQNLNKVQAQLEGSLNEYNNVDWSALLKEDPVGYLEHRRIFEERQAAFQKNSHELNYIQQLNQQEQAKVQAEFVRMQHEELIAKLPEWKDPAKAKAESQAIANHLLEMGFEQEHINNIKEHKLIILAREAMLYRAMMNKANAASKKVAASPQKILKPSVGATPNLDGRSAAMKQLSKTGKVEDAAALFGQLI